MFCLGAMSNHYHFLIRVKTQPLFKIMSGLLGGYASYYDRRHRRVGYVFQNRFKSILCDEDEYMLQLVRYIHLNPIEAGLVAGMDALPSYPWAGHAGLMGCNHEVWRSIEQVSLQFSNKPEVARIRYLAFMQNSNTGIPAVGLDGGGLARSHGG